MREAHRLEKPGESRQRLDRILDVQAPGSTGDYRLRVGPVSASEDVAADTNPPLAQRRWQHHRFNLWEHILVFLILSHFNDYDGLHVAGDWTQSVGQDAAVRSAFRAACAVGLSEEQKSILKNVLKIKAWEVPGSRM